MTKSKTSTTGPDIDIKENIESGRDSFDAALAGAREALDKAQSSMDKAYDATKSTGRAVSRKIGDSLEDAGRYLTDAKATLSNLAAEGRSQAEALYDSTVQQYEELSDRARELFGAAKETVADLEIRQRRDDVIEFLQKNPGKSVLIALGVGFLAGFIARNRS
jgi:ElaB/YqjD/DUF883 family membrane-anchored ribosome-binding protein